MVATSQDVELYGADIRSHFEHIFRLTRGYVSLALLDRNRPGSAPKETFFHWPDQAEELVTAADTARELVGVEVFYCPYPLKTRERIAGNSVVRRVVHTDADSGLSPALKRQLIRWGFCLVRSGSPGRYHVYGRMSRTMTLEEHRGILEAMRAKLKSDDKISDNDLLRVPHTLNWKNLHPDPEKRNDKELPVEIEYAGRRQIDVDALKAWLGAKSMAVRVRVQENWSKVDVSDIDRKTRALAKISVEEAVSKYGNRHQAVWAITREFASRGLASDQIHTLMDQFPAAIDKAEDERGYKVHRDVERALIQFDTVEGRELEHYSVEWVFSQRPFLKHIKEYAYASTANPWATLAIVLLRVLYATPKNVYLPGLNEGPTGTRALNMYVALIGNSGAGKKTATDAGANAFEMGIGNVHHLPIGSGEGIAKAYRRRGRGKDEPDIVIKNTRVIFDVAEVSTWNSLVGRNGATLTGEVLKGFSGESLGFSNSDDERTIHVQANDYRMCLILGAQPGTSGQLLANKNSGLPQRFLWMPTKVEEADRFSFKDRPRIPEPEEWMVPEFRSDKEFVIKFSEDAREEIYERGRWASEEDEMESQAIVIKMRVAAALALLDGRVRVDDDDWHIAGAVMLQSRRTRNEVIDCLKEVRKHEAVIKGRYSAIEKMSSDKAVERLVAEDVRRVADVVVKHLGGEPLGRGKINQALPSRDRKHLDAALVLLVEESRVAKRTMKINGQAVVKYRLRGE